MYKESIIFVTGSKSSIPFILEAQSQGYKTIVFDINPNSPCRLYADLFEAISIIDIDAIIQII